MMRREVSLASNVMSRKRKLVRDESTEPCAKRGIMDHRVAALKQDFRRNKRSGHFNESVSQEKGLSRSSSNGFVYFIGCN